MPGSRGSSHGRGGGQRFFRGSKRWNRKKYHGSKSNRPNLVASPALPTGALAADFQTRQPQTLSCSADNQSPYQGWTLYFPQEAYSESSSTVVKVNAAEKFIKKNSNLFNFTDIEDRKSFSIDLKSLISNAEFNSAWENLKQDLYAKPEHSINCLGLAMHQTVLTALHNEMKAQLNDEDEMPSITLPIVRARIVNYEPIIQLKNLKSNYYGKLVSVCGTIIRVGNIKLLCMWLAFRCNICQALQYVKQPEGVYSRPTKCMTTGCHSKTFTPLHSSPYTQTVNWQSVRLQEIVDDDHREGGRVPRTVECELTEDLLDSCVPGDVLTVTGIVKIRNSEENMRKKIASMFLIYIDVVSIVNNKNQSVVGSGKGLDIEFNIKDYYAIQEIHSQHNLFKLLVNSLCPTIYGHEIVKAGLLLALFGGSEHGECRSDPHILMVGDPGLGKSQMLQACANVAPRGVYVCGNTSTATGLTVTLTREAGGNYVLEAGALVLGDQGCCCIDEFDKMTSQHQALLEAMEQQSISIAKAGVVCSLPARTSILAAANPVGGHYNHAKTVSENLHMGSALLSRFDLVFIILDQPNEQLDVMLSEHVMALHSDLKKKEVQSKESQSLVSLLPEMSKCSLKDKLKLHPHEKLDILPTQLLRKYLIYARKYVKPRLTEAACDVIQQFYLKLRHQRQEMDCTPITTRQLESLMRLAEARAKLELREYVIQSDAEDVIEIMKHSLIDTFSDGSGGLDFQRSQNGSGMSTKNPGKKFISALQHHSNIQKRSTYSVKELKEVAQHNGIKVPDFYCFLSALNVQGFLLKKGSNLYQLLTVDY